ncbi:MAG TPA: hypothetical protein VHE35_30115 [Kofleriaceae bacterium]|nr:hypothetical protein [Kofleriaceae bacterium]
MRLATIAARGRRELRDARARLRRTMGHGRAGVRQDRVGGAVDVTGALAHCTNAASLRRRARAPIAPAAADPPDCPVIKTGQIDRRGPAPPENDEARRSGRASDTGACGLYLARATT